MRSVGYIVMLYGSLVTLGGLVGYFQSNSLISLVMGLCFGVALILSGFFVSIGKSFAKYLSLILTLALGGFFGYRYFTTLKMMPAGSVLILSLMTLMALAVQFQRRR